MAGAFQLEAQVYGRAGKPCLRCGDADPAHRAGRSGRRFSARLPAPLSAVAQADAACAQAASCADVSRRREQCFGTACATDALRYHDSTPLRRSMTPSFATSLDALGGWRAALGERARRRWPASSPSTTCRTARPRDAARRRCASGSANEKLVRRLRRRVLARQVGADQRDLLRRHRPPHPAGHARPHDDVPGRARLATRDEPAGAVAAADRDPARGPVARRAARAAARLAPPRRSTSTTPTSSRRRCTRSRAREWVDRGRRRARSASGTTTRPTTTRRATTTAGSRCRPGATR